jgi:hypothetical protein
MSRHLGNIALVQTPHGSALLLDDCDIDVMID